MKVYYRVLNINEQEGTIDVRYLTDFLSEQELRTDPADQSDPPLRCRTDVSLNLWEHNMTEQELHNYIISCAPIKWFNLKQTIIDPSVDTSYKTAKSFLNSTKFQEVIVKEEVDITDQLK